MFRRRLYYLTFSLSLLASTSGTIYCQQIIRNVEFDRSDVFDASDSTTPGWIKAFFNTLHTRSREQLLRNEILFRQNDTLQPALLLESERKLRNLDFVGDVSIQSIPDGDSCNVIVHTQDKWSLTTNASYKRDGGFDAYGFALSESNFLGMGYSLLGRVDYETDRTNPFGTQFFFIGKHLPFQGWEFETQYKSSEELRLRSIALNHPFFSEESPWSFGSSLDDGTTLRRLVVDGQITQEEQAAQTTGFLWSVVSFGDDVKYRYGLWLKHRTTSGVSLLPRNDDRQSMVQVSFGILDHVWEKTSGLNSLTRTEDVATGYALDFIVGRNFAYRSRNGLPDFTMVRGTAAANLGQSSYASSEISYTREGALGAESEQTFEYGMLVHRRLTRNDLIIIRITGTQGYRWTAGEEMVLGSPTGLRGYSQYAFSGNRQVLFNLESRHVFDTPFWIFNFGAALFADCGTAWNESQEFSHQQFHSAVGLGLRIENIKQQGIGVIRVDFPYSFDQHRIAGIIISSTHFLSAFAPVENIPPPF